MREGNAYTLPAELDALASYVTSIGASEPGLYPYDHKKRVRRHQAALAAAHRAADAWTVEDMPKVAEQYCRWLAARDGIDLSECTTADAYIGIVDTLPHTAPRSQRMRIRGVQFGHVKRELVKGVYRGKPYSEWQEVTYTDHTIEIPNWDHVPVVTFEELPADDYEDLV